MSFPLAFDQRRGGLAVTRKRDKETGKVRGEGGGRLGCANKDDSEQYTDSPIRKGG